jgi:hypothetical protein
MPLLLFAQQMMYWTRYVGRCKFSFSVLSSSFDKSECEVLVRINNKTVIFYLKEGNNSRGTSPFLLRESLSKRYGAIALLVTKNRDLDFSNGSLIDFSEISYQYFALTGKKVRQLVKLKRTRKNARGLRSKGKVVRKIPANFFSDELTFDKLLSRVFFDSEVKLSVYKTPIC